MAAALLAALLILGGGVLAQPAEAPTLSAHEQDRLRLAERDIEVAALRLALAQVQLRDAQMALRQQVQALDREGYRLERTEAGAWIYTPVEQ